MNCVSVVFFTFLVGNSSVLLHHMLITSSSEHLNNTQQSFPKRGQIRSHYGVMVDQAALMRPQRPAAFVIICFCFCEFRRVILLWKAVQNKALISREAYLHFLLVRDLDLEGNCSIVLAAA